MNNGDNKANKESKFARNNKSNAELVSAAADIATMTPYAPAVAIGKGVKIADTVTGGKASKALGTSLTIANKLAPGAGHLVQGATNLASKTRLLEKLNKAMAIKNAVSSIAGKGGAKAGGKTGANVKGSASANKLGNNGSKGSSFLSKFLNRSSSESAPTEGGVNFEMNPKTIKVLAISLAVIVITAFFSCVTLLIPYTYSALGSLSFADNINGHLSEIDQLLNSDINQAALNDAFDNNNQNKNNNNANDNVDISDPRLLITGVNQEINGDNNLNNTNQLVGYSGDIYISDDDSSNIIMIAKRTNINEFDKQELKSFYSSISNYTDKYDENLVYTFFYKLYYIEKYYKSHYSVSLDMPLLMATLIADTNDAGLMFASNTANYDINLKENNPMFDYEYDWSGYKTNKLDSSHDIELLAQHMISKQVKEECFASNGLSVKSNILSDSETKQLECEEGQTYKTTDMGYKIDEEKYRDFLKQYFEEKKYINSPKEPEGGLDYVPVDPGKSTDPGESTDPENPTDPKIGNEFAEAIVKLANQEAADGNVGGHKYRDAYPLQTHWCAMFVWWLSANTTVNGTSVYPDLVPYKSASTGEYMRSFIDSTKSNIKFYYNDQCSYYKDKNGVSYKYTPKPGDYVFVDNKPYTAWTRYNDVQDHTAIVVGYEDGVIYTVEGNMSGTEGNWINTSKVLKRSRTLSECQVIGFGSWY